MVKMEEFKKLNLVIGTILEAQEHPNADRLYILKVDIGNGTTRQLVAGIRASYKKDELINKQIVVVENLEPANIRGIESQGMLLAAKDEQSLSLIVPEKKVSPGSNVG